MHRIQTLIKLYDPILENNDLFSESDAADIDFKSVQTIVVTPTFICAIP